MFDAVVSYYAIFHLLVAKAGFRLVWHREVVDPMGHGRLLFGLAAAGD